MTALPHAFEKERQQLSDAEVLRLVRDGDLSALGVAYDRHHARVFAFLVRAMGRKEDAEDLLHNTFVTAAAAAASFDGRESSLPWLLGIAGRLAHRHRRSGLRLRRALESFRVAQDAEVFEPTRQLAARRELATVARALERLDSRKRVVLLLAEVEGFKAEQIAEALHIPLGTVWTRLHHARNEIRRLTSEAKR